MTLPNDFSTARPSTTSTTTTTTKPPTRRRAGFTLIELLLVVAVIGIIAAIAIPGLLRARISGNEAAALGSLQAVRSAESTYASTCGHNGFAQTLDDLAKPSGSENTAFISPDLSTNGVLKSGYFVKISPDSGAVMVTPAAQTCNAAADDAMSNYFVEAHPAVIGSTGQRSFASDARGSTYFNEAGATVAQGMSGASVLR